MATTGNGVMPDYICPRCLRPRLMCECGAAPRRVQVTEPHTGTGTGMKHDGGKFRWYMLMKGCAMALHGVMQVLEFGAKKYAPESWKQVENGEQRYKDALYRHLHQIETGELFDSESGELHAFHAATNALFYAELVAARESAKGVKVLK